MINALAKIFARGKNAVRMRLANPVFVQAAWTLMIIRSGDQ